MCDRPATRLLLALAFLAAVGLSGCGLLYRIDVPQGNVIHARTVDELKLGMSKRQVQYLLGTPLITDPFHPERWDYVYALKRGNGSQEHRSLTLLFDNDKLAKIASAGLDLKTPPATAKGS